MTTLAFRGRRNMSGKTPRSCDRPGRKGGALLEPTRHNHIVNKLREANDKKHLAAFCKQQKTRYVHKAEVTAWAARTDLELLVAELMSMYASGRFCPTLS